MDSAKKSEAGGPQVVPDRSDNGRHVNSSTTNFPPTDGSLPLPAPGRRPPPIWLQRLSMIVQVVLFLWAGSILLVLPWRMADVWLNTPFVATRPDLRVFLAHGFLRGLVSGLGIVNIWLGVWLAVHYHDRT